MRMAKVQMMLKTLNPTRQRRSMTAAANCHCSARLTWRSCSRTRSTKNCTSTRRACNWLSTAADRIVVLWECRAAGLPHSASRPQGTGATVDESGSEAAGGSKGGLPSFEDCRLWCIGISPTGPPLPFVPPSLSPPTGPQLSLPLLMTLLLCSGSSSAEVGKPM